MMQPELKRENAAVMVSGHECGAVSATRDAAQPATTTMHVLHVDGRFSLPGELRAAWIDLFERDPRASVQHHPDYAEVELAHLQSGRLPALVATSHTGSQLTALACLLPKTTSLHSVGGRGLNCKLHGYRLAGNALLGAGSEADAATLLATILDEVVRRRAAFLLVEELDPAAPLSQNLAASADNGFSLDWPKAVQPHWVIQLPQSAAEYWGRFSSKTRYNLRRAEKKLGDVRLLRITTPEDVSDFLERSRSVSERTWQAEQFGLRVQNSPAEFAYFTFLANQGALRSYVLMQEQRPIAFVIGIQFRGRFLYEEIGFDREFAHLSPGNVLLTKVLDDLFRVNPPEIFDFGGGDAEYKRLFASDSTQTGNLWILPPGVMSTSTLAYLRACRGLNQWTRRLVQRAGWFRQLRQRLRRGVSRPTTGPRPSEPSNGNGTPAESLTP